MMNSIRIQQVIQEGNKISYGYKVTGAWKKYFRENVTFWAEYSRNVEAVPQSVAVLPLVGNVLLMAALFNAVIYVDEIDREFYDCVENVIGGYMQISPELSFKQRGLIVAKKVVDNPGRDGQDRNMLFFSGGADAWFSLQSHLEEKPALVSIWGADLASNNDNGWKQAYQGICEVSRRFDLELITIHSTLRSFIQETLLDQFSFAKVKDNWWSAFQHSVGMMCLAAPVAVGSFRNLYFAGSYCSKDKKEWGSYVIASDPKIDNHVRFGGCQVIHDGYDFSRHDKIAGICEHFKDDPQKPYLRVCFSSAEGKNCGKCEKCVNTIMSILLSGEDPADYGFTYDEEQLPYLFASGMQEMAREEKYSFLSLYSYIQAAYRQKYTIDQVPDVLKVFYSTDLEQLADFLGVPCNKCAANKDLKVYLESVVEAKDWLEGQRDEWKQRAEELEALGGKKMRIIYLWRKRKQIWTKIKKRIRKRLTSAAK